MLTMSALPRFMICPASGVLTQIGRASEDGRRGTAIHDAIEGAILDPAVLAAAPYGGEPIDLAPIRSWFPTLAGLLIEPKVAYNVETRQGRLIRRPGARDYGDLFEGDIPGSADLALWHGETLYLADIKTGYHQDAFAGAAAGNWQLRGLALALVAEHMMLPLALAHMEHPPAISVRAALLKVREDGAVDIDEATWAPADLAGFAEDLARAWAARGPRAVTSQWCGFCPSLMACPATRQAVQALRRPAPCDGDHGSPACADPECWQQPGPALEQVETLPPAEVARALMSWRHLRRIGEAVEERAKVLAREGLLPGWRLVERERREIAGGIAHRVLLSQRGGQVAREGVEVTTTQARIKAALRAERDRSGPYARGWLAEQERAVMAEIEALGGITVRTFEQLVEDKEPALPATEEQ